MKKWLAFSLILFIPLLLLIFLRTGSDQTVTDVDALEKQIYSDYIEKYYPDTYPHERPLKLYMFRYYGTDNGYHIVSWGGMLCDVKYVKIAGYSFNVTSDTKLIAYKNGRFINLKTAYNLGLVDKGGIARAYEARHGNKPAETEPQAETLKSKRDYIRQFGPVDVFREYITSTHGYSIIYAVQQNAPAVTGVITIAGSEFKYQRAPSLCLYRAGVFTSLEEAYNEGIVTQKEIETAARTHAWYENN